VWRQIRIPPLQPCESQKATIREPGAWRYKWATLSLGDINTKTWSSRLGVGCMTDDLALQIVAKFEEVKNRLIY
jgi:hypothetical protein